MSIYIYHGSMSADTINGIDYIFVDNAEYTLPENNNKVKKMLRQGALTLNQKLASQKDEAPMTSKKGTREQRAKGAHGGVEPAEQPEDPFYANEVKGAKK